MKINRDILFAAGTVVAIAVAVIAAVLLFGGISSFSTAEKKLQKSIKRLSQLYAQKPFPSDTNVERERRNAERLQEWHSELVKSLHRGEIGPNPEDRSPSRFIELYGGTSSELRQKAKEGAVDLPKPEETFAFGFDKYHGGEQPAPDDVPVLTQQLKIVKMLCMFLIEADVDSIIAIQRQILEEKAVIVPRQPRTHRVGPMVGPRSRPGAGRPRPASGKKAAKTAAPPARGSLYEKRHFVLDFTAREQTVLDILNRLARNEAFTAVTSVSLVRPEGDILTAEETIRNAGEGAVPLAEMRGDDYPSSIERMVCGVDLEKPMTVRIKVNVYNFLEDER